MPWSQTLLPLQSCHARLSHRLFGECLQARGLADKVADDPPTIQLRFEHKATDQLTGSDDFYTHSKENRSALLLLLVLPPACSRLTLALVSLLRLVQMTFQFASRKQRACLCTCHRICTGAFGTTDYPCL